MAPVLGSLSDDPRFLLLLLTIPTSTWGRCSRHHLPPALPFTHIFALSSNILHISQNTQSNHLRFGLPRLLFPGNANSITLLPTSSYSLCFIWPNHLNRLLTHLVLMFSTFIMSLISYFFTSSFRLNPLAHLYIFISATSSLWFLWVVNGGVSVVLCSMAGCITILWLFPLALGGLLLSHSIPDIFYLFHPDCTSCLLPHLLLHRFVSHCQGTWTP